MPELTIRLTEEQAYRAIRALELFVELFPDDIEEGETEEDYYSTAARIGEQI